MPAKYTLTEAHFIIAELEAERDEALDKLQSPDNHYERAEAAEARVTELEAAYQASVQKAGNLADENLANKMEVARLREALESIARTSQAPAVAIARAALAAPTNERKYKAS